MGLRDVMYGAYERRLARQLHGAPVPRHVGVILDGNRRWARSVGAESDAGHRKGADKIADLLGWCEQSNVEVATLWLLSTDNLARPAEQLAPLLRIIENTVTDLARPDNGWRVQVV
ncbi:MAG TPA: undecaprenyl diphosphate synthase family protein, partial [Mycobacteriales bacterium]|nr:undecaprenyl diphosphate synthase family protein [Mycobacteriales bacterium]